MDLGRARSEICLRNRRLSVRGQEGRERLEWQERSLPATPASPALRSSEVELDRELRGARDENWIYAAGWRQPRTTRSERLVWQPDGVEVQSVVQVERDV